MKVKNESEVTQSCPTLRNPMDCSLPGSSIRGIFQARVLEWVASAFSEYSGLIPFRMGGWDLLAIQGTLMSLLQHHSSKTSVLWCSAFFIVQVSHPYMIIGKTIALTRWTFVGKVMSLLFNMLSGLVITFLPRNKCLLGCPNSNLNHEDARGILTRGCNYAAFTRPRKFTPWYRLRK